VSIKNTAGRRTPTFATGQAARLPLRLAGPHATIAAGLSPSCPIARRAIPGKSMTSAVGSGPTGPAPVSLRVARRATIKNNSPRGGLGLQGAWGIMSRSWKNATTTSVQDDRSFLTQFILRHIAASQMLPSRKIGKQASQKIRLSILFYWSEREDLNLRPLVTDMGWIAHFGSD
jgi:hypothetical protein